MILYVVMETAEKYRSGNWQLQRLVLEETGRDYCLMVHYKQLSRAMLAELRPRAIVYSGTSTPFEEYDVRQTQAYREVVLKSGIPQLGICGGHQLASEFFGCTLGIMRRTRASDPDHNPKYHPGEYKEWGVYPVRVIRPDPLFAGLGKVIRVQQFHRSEVKKTPPDVVVLASSPACRVQAYRHRIQPFYGVQFHPEEATEAYPDGFRILRNFFTWAAARQK
jgi:GMP synthase-like glutamine amidotransferase